MTWEKYHTVWAIMIFGWVTNYMVWERKIDFMKEIHRDK
jgi:hypothetical protein